MNTTAENLVRVAMDIQTILSDPYTYIVMELIKDQGVGLGFFCFLVGYHGKDSSSFTPARLLGHIY